MVSRSLFMEVQLASPSGEVLATELTKGHAWAKIKAKVTNHSARMGKDKSKSDAHFAALYSASGVPFPIEQSTTSSRQSMLVREV